MATDPLPNKTNPGDPITVLNPNQVKNVKTIIAVGKALGVPESGIVSALAAANDESTFLNYASSKQPQSFNYPHEAVGHDGQSVGVFQQQVGYGWGDFPEIMDPVHQAAAYYGGSPKASAPGLLQQKNWQGQDPGVLAQNIQHSGTPDAYKPLVDFGQRLYAAYGNSTPPAQLPFQPRALGPVPIPKGDLAPPAAPPAGRNIVAGPTQTQKNIDNRLNQANAGAPPQQAPAPNPRPGNPSPTSSAPPVPPPIYAAPGRSNVKAV